jgi:hypothetical protein
MEKEIKERKKAGAGRGEREESGEKKEEKEMDNNNNKRNCKRGNHTRNNNNNNSLTIPSRHSDTIHSRLLQNCIHLAELCCSESSSDCLSVSLSVRHEYVFKQPTVTVFSARYGLNVGNWLILTFQSAAQGLQTDGSTVCTLFTLPALRRRDYSHD